MTTTRTGRLLMSGAALVIVVAGVRAAGDIVAPLMLALALTIVFYPLRAGLERRMPTWAASILVLVLAYVLIIGLTLALVVAIARLAALIPTYAVDVDDFAGWVDDMLVSLGVAGPEATTVTDQLDLGRVLDTAMSFLSGILTVLSDLVFVLIVAIIDTVMLWVLDIPEPFVWGVLALVTNFIPNIGFVIGVIPPALIGFLSLIFWTWVLGPLGALLAVPMSLLLKAVLVDADPEAGWRGPLISGQPDDQDPLPET